MNEKSQRNRRRQYIIDKNFQFKYLLRILVLESVVAIVIFAASAYFFLFVVGDVEHDWGTILFQLIVILILLSIFNVMKGILISHRIVGPIYHIQKDLKKFIDGDLLTETKIRKKDEFKEFAEVVNAAKRSVADKMIQSSKDIDNAIKHIEEIETISKEKGWGGQPLFEKLVPIKEELNQVYKRLKV